MTYEQENEIINTNLRKQHGTRFPFSPSAFAQIFLVQSDLQESQRLILISQLRQRKIDLPQYTFEILRDIFLEIFAAARTQLDDPNMRSHEYRRDTQRSFYLLDVGEVEGFYGYWAEDADTSEVGFSMNLMMCYGCLMKMNTAG